MAKSTATKRSTKSKAKSAGPVMCVQCDVGGTVIVLTEAQCAAQGGTPVSRPFPCPVSVMQSMTKTAKKAKPAKSAKKAKPAKSAKKAKPAAKKTATAKKKAKK